MFHILGGVPLCGTIRASGSKNAALPMMAAAILADEPIVLERVPRLTDVSVMGRLLADLGLHISRTADRVCLETIDARPVRASYRFVRRMRAGFCVLGPLLARRREAVVPLPGGCNIGDRPVDLHLRGLAALGADLRLVDGNVVATARRLIGAVIDLRGPRGPTVTGTANVLSAAVLARGRTVIENAAQEPEIVDLGRLLLAMGARIDGLGTATIEIMGVEQLGGAHHRVIPDRIEAATLLLAAAITGGTATVTDVVPQHLAAVLERLDAAGMHLHTTADSITLRADGPPKAVSVVAEPYPGLPSDLQAQWTAFMAIARGPSTVDDGVFPARFRHVPELNRFGARIICHNSRAEIAGSSPLVGAEVTASDLRASAALVLAGLAARGATRIHATAHLDRGYERFDEKLRAMGARIERAERELRHRAMIYEE